MTASEQGEISQRCLTESQSPIVVLNPAPHPPKRKKNKQQTKQSMEMFLDISIQGVLGFTKQGSSPAP